VAEAWPASGTCWTWSRPDFRPCAARDGQPRRGRRPMSGGPGAAQVVLMDTNTKERLYAAARRATQRYPGPHPAVLHDRSELALQRLCSRPRPQIGQQPPGYVRRFARSRPGAGPERRPTRHGPRPRCHISGGRNRPRQVRGEDLSALKSVTTVRELGEAGQRRSARADQRPTGRHLQDLEQLAGTGSTAPRATEAGNWSISASDDLRRTSKLRPMTAEATL
jgi:hypothetical protein